MPLTTQARADLLSALQPHVAALADDLRARLLHPTTPAEAAAREAAQALHTDEGAGDAFDVWLDLLGHRAAVLWVLKLIYVRVLEDRGLILPRLVDPGHQALFDRLAPSLGDAAYCAWTFRDLAWPDGGLPELFAPQPAEVLLPTDDHARALLALLRERDPDTGVRRFDFAGERFDGQLLGDLYQELDPVVKERFALLQTPDFVRAFILDRTLGEALRTWPADAVRVLDPACGSGHFLIDALRRLVDATAAWHPDWTRAAVVEHALGRVVGIDLNDYAAALARARLVMTALELAGAPRLTAAATYHPQVYWADGLEQVERGDDTRGTQGELFGPQAFVRATLTPAATRRALAPLLAAGFHVVVANPPYIVERDERRKAYHKEAHGKGKAKRPRYLSATGKYGLGAPFTERCFQLAVPDGFVGIINSNAFAKREFGVALVEQVLARNDLTLLVDTSGAYIPGHGTPTLLLFARRRDPVGTTFPAVLGKRGEPANPPDPATGRVWSAILAGWDRPGFDSPFVSTEAVDRAVFAKHPWSLRGGGALGLQRQMTEAAERPLETVTTHMGITAVTGEDVVYVWDDSRVHLVGVEAWRPLVTGEVVRDWATTSTESMVWPVDRDFAVPQPSAIPRTIDYLRRFHAVIRHRKRFGTPLVDKGGVWYELQELYAEKLATPLTLTFAFVATHNQFVLDRGGKVFKQSAPVIKLPADAGEDAHLALLGPLNSSAACFWMKQTSYGTGGDQVGQGARLVKNLWEERYQFDGTKLARFPLPPDRAATVPYARALDALGHARAADTVAAALADPGWSTAAALRDALAARRARDLDRLRRMVGLQEELDWLVYRLYGLDGGEVLPPDATPPVTPGWRPFELDLAARDAAARAALARGEAPVDTPTAWFERHGWDPVPALPAEVDPAWAALVAARRARTAADPRLQLLEAPVHKRRWYRPDHAAQEQDGLRAFLLDALEAALARAPAPTTPRLLSRKLASDPRFLAAAVVVAGTDAPDLGALCARLMAGEAVAAHPVHRYTAKGLVKRKAWERTWALQAAEDRGEATGKIPVPPAYTAADFVGSVAYPLRGKLDVPKERFVAHTEVPGADGKRRVGEEVLYGWAGWTREQRVRKLFALLEDLDDQGVPAEERVALHDLMFRYADELARTAPEVAADLRADLRGEAGSPPTEVQVAAWVKVHPATGGW